MKKQSKPVVEPGSNKLANNKSKAKTTNPASPPNFPIVGIGASAGGLEALEQFFEKMPQNCGMGFVVIQHLDPNHKGVMPELLQRITAMKVFQATDRLKIKPNCVYVIPPNKSMSILNGALHLFEPVESRGLRLPIDIFFRALADDRKENSIGIILSGMGSDGSLGIKGIKEKHGLVLVQEPGSAKFDGMPRSAIEAVIPDMVAPANELPEKLIACLRLSPKDVESADILHKNVSSLEKVVILIRDHVGHDFSLYKKNTLLRRIERRKGIHQISKIQHYVRFLQENPQEIDILFKELLIGVTSFFRDEAVWEVFKNKHLPEMLNSLPERSVLRAWVTGCSTGEEAYSLAMIFTELTEKMNNKSSLQIFATDLDNDAIEKARKGYYSKNIVGEMSPERLSKFFVAEGDGYRISPNIREMVVFAPQNVIKDPPFTKLDFLFCRNMLIYMESELQKKLIVLFNYSLNSGGVLVLGTAETLGAQVGGFEELDTKNKIFKRSVFSNPVELVDFPSSFYQRKMPLIEKKKLSVANNDSIQVYADQILLQKFAPPSVLVNSAGDIVYITGRTGKYLEPVAGKANWNIYAMAREGLNRLLPGAFRKAVKSYAPIVLGNVKIGTDNDAHLVDVTIQCIETPVAIKGMVMIVFADVSAKVENVNPLKGAAGRAVPKRIKELEMDLQRSHEELQSTHEEMQTSQEELKSTNEELQSTNEELQSTNEELTTSKEEMQSLNEELQTVNIELQSKVNDYLRASDDMKNLLNSIEIASLFLDKDLNIRRFTDQITKIFKLRLTDIGRPFTDLVSNLDYSEIDDDAHRVLKTLISKESAIATNDNRWFRVRIMPYRTLDDRIDGLVMTFTDISVTKKLEIELIKANKKLTSENT